MDLQDEDMDIKLIIGSEFDIKEGVLFIYNNFELKHEDANNDDYDYKLQCELEKLKNNDDCDILLLHDYIEGM